ncbi:hypothetical protein [Paraburkholderia acidisoli]|uniref:Lipoprotein n=1 Tax=Paraburkholderia acidisoli TaxID=2571748 RepID=A0A7Z2GP85_9BURK|nr:hypothetical protein [Paraburkholderia acidisoli]QGZ65200.1 hypothetical protein FAZ98_25865 [Paraburkholderia acidisoli]
MKRLLLAAATVATLATCTAFSTLAHAQSHEPALATPAGTLQFTHAGRDFAATLDNAELDRFGAASLTHFDDVSEHGDTVPRLLVQTDNGPVLYDLRRRPALVQRTGVRMTVRRVFWQRDEVVLQGSQGWYRLMNGKLTKLQSSMTIYH